MEKGPVLRPKRRAFSFGRGRSAMCTFHIADVGRPSQTGAVKGYIIDPPFETYGDSLDERTFASLDLITDIVCRCLRQGGDTFHYSVVWANPGEEPGGIWNEDVAEAHVFKLDTEEALRGWLRKSVDPNVSGGGDVRSISTCRCVTFGYDGQALLCLRHEDEPPVSPDPSLAVVEERPDFIEKTDYFDGWARSSD